MKVHSPRGLETEFSHPVAATLWVHSRSSEAELSVPGKEAAVSLRRVRVNSWWSDPSAFCNLLKPTVKLNVKWITSFEPTNVNRSVLCEPNVMRNTRCEPTVKWKISCELFCEVNCQLWTLSAVTCNLWPYCEANFKFWIHCEGNCKLWTRLATRTRCEIPTERCSS